MTRPAVRLASPDDTPALVRLGQLAADELRTQRGGSAYLRELGRRPEDLLVPPGSGIQMVGHLGGAVVGTVALHETHHADRTVTGQVAALYVEPDARAVGVGERLVQGALEVARSRGWVALDATALPGDRATKNFFESAGLVARRLVVSIDL
ncbi:MAG: GNAT family N-acetyltransferase [Actinomycetes bacterium]